MLLEEGTMILTISKPTLVAGEEAPPKTMATGILRTIPGMCRIFF